MPENNQNPRVHSGSINAILRDPQPVTRELFSVWCLQFRQMLVAGWPGLVGLIIDGEIQDLAQAAFVRCHRRGDYARQFLDAEIERWVRLELPEYPVEMLRRGALTSEQEEDLDIVLGLR
jgi:hypothetical protein